VKPPPDPQIVAFGPTSQEAAAVIAAVDEFRRDAASVPVPVAADPRLNAWKQAALHEGVARAPDQ
jgi:hypothetical protein